MPGGSIPVDTPVEDVNAVIEKVSKKADEWASLPLQNKLDFLQQIIENLKVYRDAWHEASCQGHGYLMNDPTHAHLLGEPMVVGPGLTANWLWGAHDLYTALIKTGKPPAPIKVSDRPTDGIKSAKVFPWGVTQTVLAGGGSVEVLVEAKSKDDLAQFDPSKRPSGVVGILGAGNFDGPSDVIHQMFFENKVVVYKTNPVNCHSTKYVQLVMEPLIKAGYLAMVVGAIPQGSAITQHKAVEAVMLTGSCRTYDAIVFGTTDPEEKKSAKKRVTKPVHAELGSVNPWVIVPGRDWTDAEMDAHADLIASAKMFNNGHICASPQIVVTSKKWKQREVFLAKVRKALSEHPATRPFYPNSDKSYKEHLDALKKSGEEKDLVVQNDHQFDHQQHPVFATNQKPDQFAARQEAFCPILTEVPLDVAANAEEFLPAAVKYVNSLWGSLTTSMSIDPDTAKKSSAALEKALDDFKTGVVSLNQWGGFNPLYPQGTWGGYPGRHNELDIQSGQGFMGNSFCFEKPLKTITRMPFMHPAQAKVPRDGATQQLQASRLTDFLIHRNAWRTIKLVFHALTKH